ncbi:MAG: bacteriohemerythrin [Candidatus Sedimenticola endophacoides]
MNGGDEDFFEIFPWNKNFETGIVEIDRQHQGLVDILNRLAAHLAGCSRPATLDTVLGELADYAVMHFETEERVWREWLSGDGWLEEHEQTHRGFFERVASLRNGSDDRPHNEVIQEVVLFLSQWLAYHILESDKWFAFVVDFMRAGEPLAEAKHRANERMSGSMRLLIETVLTMYDSLSSRTLDLMREKVLRKRAGQALLESEQRWQFILDGSGESIWDWSIDVDAGVEASPGPQAQSHPIGLKTGVDGARVHPDDLEGLQQDQQRHLDGETAFYTNKHRILRPDGTWSWILSRGKVVSRGEDGSTLRMVGTHSDVTERELASLIYRNSKQAMFVTDLNNAIISANPAFTEMTGFDTRQVVGRDPGSVLSSPDALNAVFEQLRRQPGPAHWEGELEHRTNCGEPFHAYWNINTVVGADGRVDHFISLLWDITEKKQNEALIARQANFDALSGLPNRRMLGELLDREITRLGWRGGRLALMYIDLDLFKEVNDSLGHGVGDRLLAEAGERLRDGVDESDVVARIGGDEFAVILSAVEDDSHVDLAAQNLIDALGRPFGIDEHQVYVSASVGITLFPDDAREREQLERNADQAMFLAKRNGRGQFAYFTPAMQSAARQRQEILNDLRGSLERNQLEVHYQPIINLDSGQVEKAEALVRWAHPRRGVVAPDEFIPLAEEFGLIGQIDDWVSEEVFRQIGDWGGARPGRGADQPQQIPPAVSLPVCAL